MGALALCIVMPTISFYLWSAVAQHGGSLWLPYFTRFAPCGVGFHRIPLYKSNGAQIHPDWMLGTNWKESHGCIRLSRRLAAAVWDFGSVGTRVVVVRG